MQGHQALVLNADFRPLSYFPLSVLCWQDAVQAVHADKVSVVAEYDRVVRSPSVAMRLPSVVALRSFQAMPRRVAFTRFNLFLRDRFACQYCGDTFAAADLTFDHVVPRCDGGDTSWTNVVAACSPCNGRKGRFRLAPLKAPREPTPGELVAERRRFPPDYLHKSWIDYLYWDVDLDT